MTVQLTSHQLQEIDAHQGEPLVVVDPRTNTPYYLVRAEEYESVQEILDDERTQRSIRDFAFKQADRRLQEDA